MAITFGSEVEFLAGTTDYIDIVKMTSTSVVVAYRDGADSNHGTMKVGTISGTDITWGAEHEHHSGGGVGGYFNTLSALDSTKFVIAFTNGTTGDFGQMRVGTVSGTDITFGAVSTFNTPGYWMGMTAMSSTKFVLGYRESTSTGSFLVAGSVTGTTISLGARVGLGTGVLIYLNLASLTSSSFAVVYRDTPAGSDGTCRACSVTGLVITIGLEVTYTTNANFSVVSPLTSTKFVVVYSDVADSGHGTAKVGTVSSLDVTFGAETEFESGGVGQDIWVDAVSSTEFIVVWTDAADLNHGTSNVGTVSGTDITFATEAEYKSADGAFNGYVTSLNSTKFVVAYRDSSDSNHGTAQVGSNPVSSGTTLLLAPPNLNANIGTHIGKGMQ